MKATQQLHEAGQSLWLDNITRALLTGGGLKRYIDELSITGLTSNPSIFDQAIKSSGDYDAAIREKTAAGKQGEALFFELALEDLTRAADLFPLLVGVFANGRPQFGFLPGFTLLGFLPRGLFQLRSQRVDVLAQFTGTLCQLGRDFAKASLVIGLDAHINGFGSARALCFERRKPLLVSLALLEQPVERVQ